MPITYGITSWGNAYKTRLLKIKTRQNKCVRSMFFACSRDSAMPYLNILGTLTLENIDKFKVPFSHIKLLTILLIFLTFSEEP